ncbi:MAG TPA: hypothetical protein VF607_01205, partial [Verrucomicrobiae bacterium]
FHGNPDATAHPTPAPSLISRDAPPERVEYMFFAKTSIPAQPGARYFAALPVPAPAAAGDHAAPRPG